MSDDFQRWPLLLAGAVTGYLVVMAANPVRSSLRDGWRCLRRYGQVWTLPATFAVAHAAFGFWVHLYESLAVPGDFAGMTFRPRWQPPPWPDVFAASGLPSIEGAAAIFNCIVTTFPLSALWACLFLGNWRGYQGILFRGLRRRFGLPLALVVHLGLVVCAAAAVGKPILFGGLPRLNLYFGGTFLLRTGGAIDALSFIFEYLLGVGVQIYVVLLCFAWIRGLTFDFDSLRRFALRRFAFVVKWALIVMAVSILGMKLPLALANFQASGDNRWDADVAVWTTRWLLAVALLLFCSMQILLIFHNESLRRALGDHYRLLSRHAWHMGWIVTVAVLHFFLLAMIDAFIPRALGAWTWPAAIWSALCYPVLWSVLAGWLLASWVCLFRKCESGGLHLAEPVNF